MGLPVNLTYEDERYPHIILTPIGKKNKAIRSIGHKFERGVLSRLNEAVGTYVNEKKMDLKNLHLFLNIKGQTVLPVSFLKDETLHPYFIRPEFFLWNSVSKEHGLPLKDEYLYETDFTRLSSEQLEYHVREVIDDYMFIADISSEEREEWLTRIVHSFHAHPIVLLAHEKKNVIQAVETMNQSALLSVLKYPEDVSFWRHRVEIVMRPFRALPDQWLNSRSTTCPHQKDLQFHSGQKKICCYCEVCDYQVFYFTDHDKVLLEEEFDPVKAGKRIKTIHQQFNDIADKNTDLLYQLRQLSFLKEKFIPYRNKLDEALQIAHLIKRYKHDEPFVTTDTILDMYEKLNHSDLPIESFESNLIWLAHIKLADVSMVKQVEGWVDNIPEDIELALDQLLQELNERLSQVVYQEDDIIITIKDRSLDYASVQQMLDLIHYYGTDYPAHTLVQVLAGKSTNKLRRLHLHETRWFGLLSDWPEKYIQRLFKQLENQGWLMKQSKGYSISQFAEEVM
ncbi:RQC-minor-2 family DNA-binding protein [Halobacillus campisalis]|uniref:RQC-minor-2 family DNA-binding protein n=1 Tax=Halobacillus campisalis TaxID=435909 RepID=A0ABW2JZZ1_9BACI|nr:RQC-minor-2 family DNA-binding protein [Halobacillus campisalis]